MSDPYKPRRAAAAILGRVVREGAFSNVVLRSGLDDLDPPEAARTRGLVYGTLRCLKGLDRMIAEGAGRSVDRIEAPILDVLRVAAFEITSSDVPDPVAVSVGVDLVREIRPQASGMANAVLRRVVEAPAVELGLELPEWLSHSLARIWDGEEVSAFVAASSQEAARIGRLRSGEPGQALPVVGVKSAYELPPGPVPDNFMVQDSASIAVVNALGVEPGMRIVDLAAAPGGKTQHLVDIAGPQPFVIGVDSHQRRVRSAARRVREAWWIRADASRPPLRPASFDRVLLDAPCSGLGTLRRRPEILYRVSSGDVQSLHILQRRMLESALALVAPGGRLVYSVCTVTPEETIDVVDGLGMVSQSGIGEDLGVGRLLAPHTTATDGMFVSRWDG